jgi:hypothetical protein
VLEDHLLRLFRSLFVRLKGLTVHQKVVPLLLLEARALEEWKAMLWL